MHPHTSPLVLPLEAVGLEAIGDVGGKNASLGEMIRELAAEGVRVPGGFATTAEAYRLFIRSGDLQPQLHRLLDGLDGRDIASLQAAGAGARVAKHGNRAMSSVCGSADVLEGLGVRIDLDAAGVARCLAGTGIGFMLAPRFHPALRFAGPVRREIGIRTAFNLLGPLCNPARAQHQVIGVPQAALVPVIARTLARLEAQHALVVHGHGGMDELTLSDDNTVLEVVRGQEPIPLHVDLAALGLHHAGIAALRGGDVATNVAIVRDILAGHETGPRRDVVVLNAAAALLAADIAGDLAHGVSLAHHSISSGAAAECLARLVELSTA